MKLTFSIPPLAFVAPHLEASNHTARSEPGLLPAFRIMLALQLLVTLLSGIAVALRRLEPLQLPFWVSGLTLLVLLIYLSWPVVQRWLGRAFLPVALAVAIALPLIDRLLFLRNWLERTQRPFPEELVNALGWRGAIWLLIPLVLLAWQYDFRRVLWVSGALIIGDWTLLTKSFDFSHAIYVSIFGIVVGEGITFVVVGYIVTRIMDAQRRQRRALAEANQQLTHYAATIEQLATSRERNRLARELHDTLAHTLSALAVQLEAVDTAWHETPAEAHTLLVKSLAQTRSGLMEARRSLHALRASPLEDLGLVLAIRTVAEATAVRTGALLQLVLSEAPDNLPPDVEQGLYRIAQEALNNVAKHAAARQITVTLCQSAATLSLTVADDGQGFDAALGTEQGFGLRGMQERATLMGATLQVTSARGMGTTVTVRFPKGVHE